MTYDFILSSFAFEEKDLFERQWQRDLDLLFIDLLPRCLAPGQACSQEPRAHPGLPQGEQKPKDWSCHPLSPGCMSKEPGWKQRSLEAVSARMWNAGLPTSNLTPWDSTLTLLFYSEVFGHYRVYPYRLCKTQLQQSFFQSKIISRDLGLSGIWNILVYFGRYSSQTLGYYRLFKGKHGTGSGTIWCLQDGQQLSTSIH